MKKQITPLLFVAVATVLLSQTASAHLSVPDAGSTSLLGGIALGGLFVLRKFLRR